MRLALALAAAALSLAPATARAHADAQVPDFHTHDSTYLRLQLGGGYASFSTTVAGKSTEVSGPSVSPSLAVGVTIAPDLIAYGELFLEGVQHPFGAAGGDANVYGVGLGAAYYLARPNVFGAATLSLAKMKVDSSGGGVVVSSGWGPGLELLAGKEWWLSANLGLGVAARGFIATVGSDIYTPGGGLPRWTLASVGLMLSATYN